MFHLVKLVLASSFFLASLDVSAGFTTWSKLKNVIVHDRMGVILVFDYSEAAVNQGCMNEDRVVISPDHYLFEVLVSSALSAFHAESGIRVWTTRCVADGGQTYPQGTRIDIK